MRGGPTLPMSAKVTLSLRPPAGFRKERVNDGPLAPRAPHSEPLVLNHLEPVKRVSFRGKDIHELLSLSSSHVKDSRKERKLSGSGLTFPPTPRGPAVSGQAVWWRNRPPSPW